MYTIQEGEADIIEQASSSEEVPEIQLLITPSPDSVHFQNGYLGADGERAAIEGEVHVKGGDKDMWNSVYAWSLC